MKTVLRLCWETMTADDVEAQKNDFSLSKGRNGYLTGPHGAGPLDKLASEAIKIPNENVMSQGLVGRHIPSAELRARLPDALALVPKAYKPEDHEKAIDSLVGFVTMAEELETYGIRALICPFIIYT